MKYKFFNLQDISLSLIILPYLLFNMPRLLASPFYSSRNLFFLVSIIFLTDIFFSKLFKYLNKNIKNLFSILILTTSFFLIYGFYLTNYFQNSINYYFGILVRGRVISIPILLITLIIFKPKYFKNLKYFSFNF